MMSKTISSENKLVYYALTNQDTPAEQQSGTESP